MCDYKRVLFVDDDAIILRVMRRSLGEAFDISVADSGKKALELVDQEEPFDCLVTDMRMPQMDGVELVKLVNQKLPDLPCIILTGNQDDESETRATSECNIFRLLNKPCPRDVIIEAVEEAIKSSKSADSNRPDRNDHLTSV